MSNYAGVSVGTLISIGMRLLNPPSTYGATSAISILTYQDSLLTLMVD